jgi:hypothetical protein
MSAVRWALRRLAVLLFRGAVGRVASCSTGARDDDMEDVPPVEVVA